MNAIECDYVANLPNNHHAKYTVCTSFRLFDLKITLTWSGPDLESFSLQCYVCNLLRTSKKTHKSHSKTIKSISIRYGKKLFFSGFVEILER